MKNIDHLMAIFLPVFNEHMTIEGDGDLVMTAEQAKRSQFFRHWCEVWGDDERGDLHELLNNLEVTQ
jgi:uncharacterized protein YhfF